MIMTDKLPMLWVLRGHYGIHGWEDLTASEIRPDVVTDLANYQRSEPGRAFKIIRRRQKEGE